MKRNTGLACMLALIASSLTPAAWSQAQFKNVFERDEFRRAGIRNLQPFDVDRFIPMCFVGPEVEEDDIDVDRSILVRDTISLGGLDLSRTLDQLASQVSAMAPGTTGDSIFRQLWDTQNTAATGVTPGPHCDDGGGQINGYPNSCPRPEGAHASASGPDIFWPIAASMRLDLAHEGWRNCGEYRLAYGHTAGPGKNTLIFEAVLPNPRPGCRSGCDAVAQFWKSLSTVTSPHDRRAMLETFFYDGLPGFQPVVHVNHFSALGASGYGGSAGSGQIRTNQFHDASGAHPWVLKEFKTLLDCGTAPCTFTIMPISVKNTPFGRLWNEDRANNPGVYQSRAQSFQAALIPNIPHLASDDIMGIGHSVAAEHNGGQSVSSELTSANYFWGQFSLASGTVTTFRDALASASAAHGLTSEQVVSRATAVSCAGCHAPPIFGLTTPGAIGNVTLPTGGTTDRWPNSNGFVHIYPSVSMSEFSDRYPIFGSGSGFVISAALKDVFLPARRNVLVEHLNAPVCPCTPTFTGLASAVRPKALAIVDRVDQLFRTPISEAAQRATRIAAVQPLDVKAYRAALADWKSLVAQRDGQISAQLKQNGIDIGPAPTLSAEPLRLSGKPEQRAAQFAEILATEPPRRTVTGSFVPH